MNITRRDALKGIGSLTIGAQFGGGRPLAAQAPAGFDVAAIERDRVIKAANAYLKERPITITASSSPRSTGGRHDFFSEGDYWWPDPQNPGGPYIQRDGMTNPDNFVEHRRALMRLSVQMPALVAAWKLTGEMNYARHASRHLRVWFTKPDTKMNPHLLYAQAIHGRFTGRGIGIIDTIHLVEVARAIEIIRDLPLLAVEEWKAIHEWFAEYVRWMTTHKYGLDERDAKNNHGTCWVMQVAAFAHLTNNEALLASCRERYKTVLLPGQLGMDGSFPLEVKRTKPYCYSLFNLEAMAAICRIASTPDDNLWTFELKEPEPPSGRSMAGGEALGRGMRLAMNFMTPYFRDKSKWPYPRDVMYDEHWPMRQQSLLFAGLALDRPADLELWKTLPPDSTVEEVIRNYFIRQPILWI
jgi:Alginate lyase